MDFYDLTPTEINDIITAEIRRHEDDNKSRAVFAYQTALLTGLAVNAPKKFPKSASEHFPWLDNEPEWIKSKRRMAQFAAQHNMNYRRK